MFLCAEDFVGVECNPGMNAFDCLLIAAEIAQKKLDSVDPKLSKKRARESGKLQDLFPEIPEPKEVGEKGTKRHHASKKIKTVSCISRNDMPLEFKAKVLEMGGTDLVLVIQKKLFKSDVKKGNNRFSVPLTQVENPEFLTPEEKEHLNSSSIQVLLLEPDCGSTCLINLRKWKMPKENGSVSWTYNLLTTWNAVRERNGLKVGDTVQLWAFREKSSRKLCFAVVPLNTNA